MILRARQTLLWLSIGLGLSGCPSDPVLHTDSPREVSTATVAVGANWSERLHTYRAHRVNEAPASGVPLDTLRRADGPTIFAFWATYCPPCIAEMPMFEAFHRAGHRVVGVSMDAGQTDAVQAVLRRQKVTYPQVILQESSMRAAGLALESGLPFTLVTHAEGGIKHTFFGKVGEAEIRAALRP